jgi:hypothetical protein
MGTERSLKGISKIVLEGLKILSKNPSLNISEIAIQDYFYNKKSENPEKYTELSFHKKEYIFYSKNLNNILLKFRNERIIDINNRFIE